jgi:hypothetical protein
MVPIILWSGISLAQTSKEGEPPWKSIIPLVSTMKQVESLLGPPMSKNGYVRTYDTPDFRITIWYGGVKPGKDQCKLDVPSDTVLDLLVGPKKKLLVTETGFDLRGFKKERTMNEDVWNYVNEATGIQINAHESEHRDEIVVFLKFSPTANDQKDKCVPSN